MCVYVREITNEEGNRLLRIVRQGKEVVSVRRASVVLASAQGMKVPEIARLYHYTEKHVRDIIHAFNQDGFSSLKPNYGGGRPWTFTPEQRMEIVEIAISRPSDVGQPFTRWSLPKLTRYLIEKGVVPSISVEEVRQILREHNVSFQRTRTWKESNDPEFEFKKSVSGPSFRARRRTG